MTLYIRAANPKHEEYLRMGMFIPMKIGPETTEGDLRVREDLLQMNSQNSPTQTKN